MKFHRSLLAAAAAVVALAAPAHAVTTSHNVQTTGIAEGPPNSSTALGQALVTFNDVAPSMPSSAVVPDEALGVETLRSLKLGLVAGISAARNDRFRWLEPSPLRRTVTASGRSSEFKRQNDGLSASNLAS